MPCHECSGSTGSNTHTLHPQVRSVVSEERDSVTEVVAWTSLPLFQQGELPEDLDLIGGSSQQGKAWRIPVSRILPGGDLNQFRYVVEKKMSIVTVPRGHVVPVFIPNAQEEVSLAVGQEGKWAQALAIADTPTKVALQANGFITFPRTHVYTVGKTYYLSKTAPGEVVSVKPSGDSQALFTVIDEVTLMINVELK